MTTFFLYQHKMRCQFLFGKSQIPPLRAFDSQRGKNYRFSHVLTLQTEKAFRSAVKVIEKIQKKVLISMKSPLLIHNFPSATNWVKVNVFLLKWRNKCTAKLSYVFVVVFFFRERREMRDPIRRIKCSNCFFVTWHFSCSRNQNKSLTSCRQDLLQTLQL